MRDDRAPDRPEHRAREIGVFLRRLVAVDDAPEMVDPDPEVPFAGPDPGGIEPALVIVFLREDLRQVLRQGPVPGPGPEEAAADHRVEHSRVPRQVLPQRGGGVDDVDHEVQKLWIGLEEGKELNARREAGEEPGGSCNGIAEMITFTGPGMQARWRGQPTDFWHDRPFARAAESPDADFYATPRKVSHIDRTASRDESPIG